METPLWVDHQTKYSDTDLTVSRRVQCNSSWYHHWCCWDLFRLWWMCANLAGSRKVSVRTTWKWTDGVSVVRKRKCKTNTTQRATKRNLFISKRWSFTGTNDIMNEVLQRGPWQSLLELFTLDVIIINYVENQSRHHLGGWWVNLSRPMDRFIVSVMNVNFVLARVDCLTKALYSPISSWG